MVSRALPGKTGAPERAANRRQGSPASARRGEVCEGRKVKSLFAWAPLPIIGAMDFSGKDYDRIRASRRKASGRGGSRDGGGAADATVIGRECAVKGCKSEATYRAPKGRGKEGQFFWFCLDHVREYNKSYNYFNGMSDDDVLAYQRDAITGHRPTSPIGVRGRQARAARNAWTGMVDDTFGLFGGQDPHPAPEAETRRISAADRHAFEILGLEPGASKEAIKSRYKTLVKRHHPDANQGDRSSEDRLRSIINAYNMLRRAGYC
nr:J domain-containing protein [Acuticoccus yangtzensis]